MAGLQFKTMTVEECHEIASSSFQELGRFMKSHSYQSTGHQVLGWRDRRQVDDNQVKFLLTKAFRGFTPVEVLNRAWAVMTDPDGMKSMYSASMNLSIKRVQVVDDDNIVLYRVITGPDGRSQIKSLFLATRFHVGEEALLVYRSIDPKRLVELDTTGSDTPEDEGSAALSAVVRAEIWMDIFSWWVCNMHEILLLASAKSLMRAFRRFCDQERVQGPRRRRQQRVRVQLRRDCAKHGVDIGTNVAPRGVAACSPMGSAGHWTDLHAHRVSWACADHQESLGMHH